jgi:hypothetical protein
MKDRAMDYGFKQKISFVLLAGALLSSTAVVASAPGSLTKVASPLDGFWQPTIKTMIESEIKQINGAADETARKRLATELLYLLLVKRDGVPLRMDLAQKTTPQEQGLLITALLHVAAVYKDKEADFSIAERKAKSNPTLFNHLKLSHAIYLAAIGQGAGANGILRALGIKGTLPSDLEARTKAIQEQFGKVARTSIVTGTSPSSSKKAAQEALLLKFGKKPETTASVSSGPVSGGTSPAPSHLLPDFDLDSSRDASTSPSPDAPPMGGVPLAPDFDAPPIGGAVETYAERRDREAAEAAAKAEVEAAKEGKTVRPKLSGRDMAGGSIQTPPPSSEVIAAQLAEIKRKTEVAQAARLTTTPPPSRGSSPFGGSSLLPGSGGSPGFRAFKHLPPGSPPPPVTASGSSDDWDVPPPLTPVKRSPSPMPGSPPPPSTAITMTFATPSAMNPKDIIVGEGTWKKWQEAWAAAAKPEGDFRKSLITYLTVGSKMGPPHGTFFKSSELKSEFDAYKYDGATDAITPR